MGDLKSKEALLAKGILFLCLLLLSAAVLFSQAPSAYTACLLLVLIWSSCRFYYFLFYVLERYVDRSLRYPGIVAMLRAIATKHSPRE